LRAPVLHRPPRRAGYWAEVVNPLKDVKLMKILLWIVVIIFLIGLAVVLGLGSLIF
jgi:hypothetical protein